MKKDKIKFQLINNLVVVPVALNGVELSFLLDTGVNNTILFGITAADSISLKGVVPIKIKGLGNETEIDAIKSSGNIIKIGNAIDERHTVYVVLNEMVDFSKRMGIPIHGIIGSDFYQNFVVKTNYNSKRITVYNPENFNFKNCRRCDEFELEFFKSKPHIKANVLNATLEKESILLIDSGSSDALWLFGEDDYIETFPMNYFDDFLGMSISGSIYGKRSRVDGLSLGDFDLIDVTVAFPQVSKKDSLRMYKNRAGSIGGEILKRFTVVMDYQNNRMQLKRNSQFKRPFNYNLSGLTLEYDGTVQIKELQDIRSESMNIQNSNSGGNKGSVNVMIDPIYSLFTAPKVVVADLREGSPAQVAGLQKGDAIVKVNDKFAYKYKIYELTALFSSKVGRKITIEFERDGLFNEVKFTLTKSI
ncbi:MAG: aspartyl protease family protein [Patiriisocius sp.]|uniref:aspartyl protease family protein n=1 Tax=Patiriisocius sp. TaxID=2822396 RepID=UPI003EF9A08B